MVSAIHPMTFLLGAVFTRALSQVLIKMAALESLGSRLSVHLFVLISICAVLFFFRAVLWQKALENYSLSFAYPFYGITIISLMLFGYFLFGEQLGIGNVIGSLLVFSGICLIAGDSSGGFRSD